MVDRGCTFFLGCPYLFHEGAMCLLQLSYTEGHLTPYVRDGLGGLIV